MVYVGVFFKKKSGGVICFYSPDWSKPIFWYFSKIDSPKFIINKFKTFTQFQKVTVHINDVDTTSVKQSKIYHTIMGSLFALDVYDIVKYKSVDLKKCLCRVKTLLCIKDKKSFIEKLTLKKMHENQYNIVSEITQTMSKQNQTNYRNAYLLAYYGYLKNKVSKYGIRIGSI